MVLKCLFILGVLSFTSIFVGMCIVSTLLKLFDVQISNVINEDFFISLQVCFFAWPAITFIAIKLDKKVDQFIKKTR